MSSILGWADMTLGLHKESEEEQEEEEEEGQDTEDYSRRSESDTTLREIRRSGSSPLKPRLSDTSPAHAIIDDVLQNIQQARVRSRRSVISLSGVNILNDQKEIKEEREKELRSPRDAPNVKEMEQGGESKVRSTRDVVDLDLNDPKFWKRAGSCPFIPGRFSTSSSSDPLGSMSSRIIGKRESEPFIKRSPGSSPTRRTSLGQSGANQIFSSYGVEMHSQDQIELVRSLTGIHGSSYNNLLSEGSGPSPNNQQTAKEETLAPSFPPSASLSSSPPLAIEERHSADHTQEQHASGSSSPSPVVGPGTQQTLAESSAIAAKNVKRDFNKELKDWEKRPEANSLPHIDQFVREMTDKYIAKLDSLGESPLTITVRKSILSKLLSLKLLGTKPSPVLLKSSTAPHSSAFGHGRGKEKKEDKDGEKQKDENKGQRRAKSFSVDGSPPTNAPQSRPSALSEKARSPSNSPSLQRQRELEGFAAEIQRVMQGLKMEPDQVASTNPALGSPKESPPEGHRTEGDEGQHGAAQTGEELSELLLLSSEQLQALPPSKRLLVDNYRRYQKILSLTPAQVQLLSPEQQQVVQQLKEAMATASSR